MSHAHVVPNQLAERLKEVFIEAHELHIKLGIKGCDPRLFWLFPAYRYSLKKRSRIRALLRKIESLSIRLFPGIIRPYQYLCGIPDVVSPYGLALFVQAYCKAYKIFSDKEYLSVAVKYAELLEENLVGTRSGNLGVTNPLESLDEINLPAGSEAIFALVDLYDISKEKAYLRLAEKIADSFLNDFSKKAIGGDRVCLDYTVGADGRYVLNANALAAGAMAQVAQRLGDVKYDELITSIVNYIGTYVLSEADLPYAGVEDHISAKVYDVYHTGFTLRGLSLALSRYAGNVDAIADGVKIKAARMRTDFLDKKGRIRSTRSSPIIDVHGVAEYIRCISDISFTRNDIDTFVNNIGYMHAAGGFYYQRGFRDISLYMPRWGHGPMMLAIVEFMAGLRSIDCCEESEHE